LTVADVPRWVAFHRDVVGLLSFFGQATDEPSVIGWMPAAAVYFRNRDGHTLEYLAMLEGLSQPGLGVTDRSQRDR
jgi:lactoylglutathione lyase